MRKGLANVKGLRSERTEADGAWAQTGHPDRRFALGDPENQAPWSRIRGTIPDIDEPLELQSNGHWRMAVWAFEWAL
jgi:hypothetical protein